MASKKKKKKSQSEWLTILKNLTSTPEGRAYIWRGAQVALGVVGLFLALRGLGTLQERVARADVVLQPAQIRLIDAPADIGERVAADLARFSGRSWGDPKLCAEIGEALSRNGWVRHVREVRRVPGGFINVRCAYRTPLAMVASPQGYVLVDKDGVRLPGVYAYHPAFKLIQGVGQLPPSPGKEWPAPDLHAGVELVELLSTEPYADQITGILVGNYGGRENRMGAQITLATDRTGGRIIWGSPVGEEIEENTYTQKLDLLRANYSRYGRIDANRPKIDISLYPDRYAALDVGE